MTDESPPARDAGDVAARGGPLEARGAPMQTPGNVIPFRRTLPLIELRGAAEIFAPLPPTPWISQALQMGPGRPVMLVGYGASAKTLAAQSLELSVATGQLAWERFVTQRGKVIHLDYEQGFSATARRYQRLARGMGIEPGEVQDRLSLAVFPECFLNTPGAVDAYAKTCEGASLVVLDALRGALPNEDENASGIRGFVDLLTRVSEKTGATVLLLHHAGKPKEGHADARTVVRGSSALFDASGCVLLVTNQKKGAPRLVQQIKAPAEAEAAGVEDFGLAIEDVPGEEGEPSGVRVVYSPIEPTERESDQRYQKHAQILLGLVRANPGRSQTFLRAHAGFRAQDVKAVLDLLVEERRLVVLEGERSAKTYRIGDLDA